eukprot:Gb_34826 [translate_table: standard]
MGRIEYWHLGFGVALKDMDVEIAEKSLGNKRMYNRSGTVGRSQQVCIFWQEGRCNREVCNFLHVGEAGTVKRGGTSNGFGPKRSYHSSDDRDIQGAGPPGAPRRNISARWGRGRGGRILTDERHKVRDKVCNFWLAGNCKHGEDCKFLHSYTVGADITFLTQLAGHEKAVRGIAFPSNSDKLYSGGQDGTVRVWDCQTGQCISNIKLSGEIGCLLNEGPWLFVGLPNAVKGWNIQTSAELNLDGPRGQVHALVVGNGMLLAGVQDGNILAWKFSPAANSFEPTASLAGHTLAVVTLVAGADRLYSGSMDQTIRLGVIPKGLSQDIMFFGDVYTETWIGCWIWPRDGVSASSQFPVLYLFSVQYLAMRVEANGY